MAAYDFTPAWVPRIYQWHSSLNGPISVIYSLCGLMRRTVQDCPIRIMLRGINVWPENEDAPFLITFKELKDRHY